MQVFFWIFFAEIWIFFKMQNMCFQRFHVVRYIHCVRRFPFTLSCVHLSQGVRCKKTAKIFFLQHLTHGKHCNLRYPRLSLFNCGETRLFYNAKGDKVVSPGQVPILLQHSASVQSWKTGSYSMTLYRNLIWEKNYNVYSRPDFKHLFISYIYYDSMNSPHSSYIFSIYNSDSVWKSPVSQQLRQDLQNYQLLQ